MSKQEKPQSKGKTCYSLLGFLVFFFLLKVPRSFLINLISSAFTGPVVQ